MEMDQIIQQKLLCTHISVRFPMIFTKAALSWRRRLRLSRAQVFNTELYKDRTSTFNIVILLNLSYNMYTKLNPQTRGAHWFFVFFSSYFFSFSLDFFFFLSFFCSIDSHSHLNIKGLGMIILFVV